MSKGTIEDTLESKSNAGLIAGVDITNKSQTQQWKEIEAGPKGMNSIQTSNILTT